MSTRRFVRALALIGAMAVVVVQPAVPANSAPPQLTIRFDAQPADAKIGETVTTVPFTRTAPRPRVALYDGNRLANIRTSVVISLVREGGTPTQLFTVTTDRGVATLPAFSVATAEERFRLHAFAPDVPTEALSGPFDIYEVVEPCSPGNCRAAINRPATIDVVVTAGANSGHLALNLGDVAGLTPCGGGSPDNHAPMLVTQDEAGLDADKTAVMTIAKEIVESRLNNNGASFYEVCFSKDGLNFGSSPLPACPSRRSRTQPCVISNNKTGAGDVQITLHLPAGDPTWW